MKKLVALLLVTVMLLSFAACSTSDTNKASDPTSANNDPIISNDGETSDNFEDHHYKIAYIIGSATSSDVFNLQSNAAKEEAESLGMTLDVFYAGDATAIQDYFQRCINQGYDAIYCHGASETYSAEMVKPALEKGIPVICMEYTCRDENGNVLDGVTEMMQDDQQMSSAILDYAVNVLFPDKEQVNVLRLYADVGFDPFIRRNAALEEYIESGKINVVETVGPDSTNSSESVMNNVAALLPVLGDQIDMIWSCYDAYAQGAYLALKNAGKSIPIVTVDISNEDLMYMQEEGSCFVACASPAPQSIGQQAVRILAMRLHGDEVEDTYMLSAALVPQSELGENANVNNLGEMVDGYGESADHLPDWMVECKARVAG